MKGSGPARGQKGRRKGALKLLKQGKKNLITDSLANHPRR